MASEYGSWPVEPAAHQIRMLLRPARAFSISGMIESRSRRGGYAMATPSYYGAPGPSAGGGVADGEAQGPGRGHQRDDEHHQRAGGEEDQGGVGHRRQRGAAGFGAALAVLAVFGTAASAWAADSAGKTVFQKNCAACHQATGKGIPGAFPALAGSAFVQGPVVEPATVLLKGRGGMPDFSQSLDDGDIAAVLTYARSSWGNQAPGLAAGDVAALRTEISAEAFTAGQLSNNH